jgi:hypothetical protein
MLRRWNLAAFALAAVTALAGVACSSSEASQDDDSEGALETSTDRFDFKLDSAKERAGQVDLGNSYWMAKLSLLAYDNGDVPSLKKALGDIGIQAEEIVPFHAKNSLNPLETRIVTGTDGYYFRTKKAGFLVFRGSEPGKLNDAITDARVLKMNAGPSANNAGDGSVHEGFYHALHAVWDDQLHDLLKDRHGDKRLPLIVTGHSLGGALGTIAVHHLLFDGCLTNLFRHVDVLSACERDYVPVFGLYTFGSPRTGDEEFISTLTERMRTLNTKVFRFVSEQDQVSTVPRYVPAVPLIKPFRHLGEKNDERALAIFLDKVGKMFPKPESRCAENKDLVQCDISTSALADGIANNHPFWKGEHAMMIYTEKLRGLLTGKPPELDKIREELTEKGQY